MFDCFYLIFANILISTNYYPTNLAGMLMLMYRQKEKLKGMNKIGETRYVVYRIYIKWNPRNEL